MDMTSTTVSKDSTVGTFHEEEENVNEIQWRLGRNWQIYYALSFRNFCFLGQNLMG